VKTVKSERVNNENPISERGDLASSDPSSGTVMLQTKWLTASEAAAYLRIKPRTLLQWVRQGKLQAHALSGTQRRTWRFRQSDLDALLVAASVLPSKTPSVRPAERTEK